MSHGVLESLGELHQRYIDSGAPLWNSNKVEAAPTPRALTNERLVDFQPRDKVALQKACGFLCRPKSGKKENKCGCCQDGRFAVSRPALHDERMASLPSHSSSIFNLPLPCEAQSTRK